MKILVLSHEYPPVGGGGANACRYLAGEFAKNGDDVTIVTVDYPELPGEEVPAGVRIYRLPAKRSSADHCSFFEMLDYLRRALAFSKKLLKREHFDVCLAFFGIPSGPAAYVLNKKYGLPYLIRFGGGDVPGFQERFTFVYKLLGPFIRWIWNEAGFRIANSEGLKQLALNFYDKVPFDVVPNGVDTGEFYPEEAPDLNVDNEAGGISVDKPLAETGGAEENDIVNILFVSRLIERKGLQYVLNDLPVIRDAAGRSIRLTVVGDGPYKDNLLEIVKGKGLQDIVSFEGAKAHGELPPYYRNADLFILPSEKEGMPNVVLEAMASGLPVLMTPCQGSSELINGNGYVAEIDEFSSKLIELIKDEELRKIMGEKSRRIVEDGFTWEKTALKYREFMEKLL